MPARTSLIQYYRCIPLHNRSNRDLARRIILIVSTHLWPGLRRGYVMQNQRPYRVGNEVNRETRTVGRRVTLLALRLTLNLIPRWWFITVYRKRFLRAHHRAWTYTDGWNSKKLESDESRCAIVAQSWFRNLWTTYVKRNDYSNNLINPSLFNRLRTYLLLYNIVTLEALNISFDTIIYLV